MSVWLSQACAGGTVCFVEYAVARPPTLLRSHFRHLTHITGGMQECRCAAAQSIRYVFQRGISLTVHRCCRSLDGQANEALVVAGPGSGLVSIITDQKDGSHHSLPIKRVLYSVPCLFCGMVKQLQCVSV